MVAPLCYALNAISVALLRPPGGESVQYAAGLMFAATVVSMLAVMVVTGEWWAFEGDFGDGHWATIASMANNALYLLSDLPFYLIFELIKRAGPVFFSVVNYVVTSTSMGFGIWLFQEVHSSWIWAALVLIGTSLVQVNFISIHSRPQTPDQS